jgi:hypothetical protein
MLASDVFARAVVLSAMAVSSPDMATSPNMSGLVGRQTSGNCKTTEKPCADGCMPLTGVCCAS